MLLVLCLLFVSVLGFSPDRTKLVDYSPSNQVWVIRGSEPLYPNQTFAYDPLVASFRKVVPSLPPQIYIVDYNLLYIELTDENAEKAFFVNNPGKGMFIHDPIFGSLTNPQDFPDWARKEIATELRGLDNLPFTMATLENLKNANYPLPAVVYIHCEAGKDRTGEVSGSYYITYSNWTLNQAYYYDNHCVEGSRAISPYSRNGLQWYCYYLYYTTRPTLDCTINPKFVGNCNTPIF